MVKYFSYTALRFLTAIYIDTHYSLLPQIQGLDAGIHACLELRRDDLHEAEIVARSYQQGVVVHALSHYYLGSPDKKGLLLGYGGLEKTQIMEGIRRLAEVIQQT